MNKSLCYKILGIVILYNPDIDEAFLNIKKYVESLDSLIVWDNSDSLDLRKLIKNECLHYSEIIYVSRETNFGISKPLNFAVNYLFERDFDFLLTMDQDSAWENFSYYKDSCFRLLNGSIGAFSPNINGAFSVVDESSIEHRAITSGCLIPKKTFSLVGEYNERFFVDGIDVDFRTRIEENGLYVIRINNAILNQKYGNSIVRKPWNYLAPEYSPFRLYGILYSHIWLMRHHKMSKNFIFQVIYCYFFLFIFDIIFYQNGKLSKLRSIFRGIKNGLMS